MGLDLRQRRLTIGIILGTLAITALFFAQGTTTLLAASLFELDPAGMSGPEGPGGSPPGPLAMSGGLGLGARRSSHRDPTTILHRNIFDSTAGPLDGVIAANTIPAEEATPLDPNAPPPACDGSFRLVGAIVWPNAPERSFAAITDATGKAMLYRLGAQLDGREILAIYPSVVYMRPGAAGACSLAMFNPAGQAAVGEGAVATVAPMVGERPPGADGPPSSSIPSAELDRGIQRMSDTQFNISRGLVDRVLTNQAELMRTARIVPHQEGGRTVGVKLYGIRRNSLLGRVGIENGDVLRTINGYDMTSPDSALEAYARLRNADHLTVSVMRRGAPMTINYAIQ